MKLPGLSKYLIYDDGRIARYTRRPQRPLAIFVAGGSFIETRHEMATRLNDEGYVKVKLTRDDGQRKDYFVHKLVAQAFLPPPTVTQTQVRHKDGNRQNCAADNLLWGTHADNHADKVAHGTHKRGSVRKLSKKDVRNIRRSKSGAAKIAKRKGLSISHVRDIKNGRRHRKTTSSKK